MGTVSLRVAAGLATLTLENEAKANALTGDMLAQLLTHCDTIAADPAIRMCVITGSGTRFFCAGADINEWSSLNAEEMGCSWIRRGARAFERVSRLDIVTVAALNGAALGGGLELALATDFRIAAEGVTLGFPETGIGAIPGWFGAQRVSHLAGVSLARRMVLLGTTLTAREAQDARLIDFVCPPDRIEEEIEKLRARALARSPAAISVAKRLIDASCGRDVELALHELAATAARASADAEEGIAAFQQKRKPDYLNKDSE